MTKLCDRALTALLFAVTLTAYAAEPADKKMVNDDVLALLSAGVDQEIVVSKIMQAPLVAFDVSTDELIRLSKLHTPKKVVDAMLQRMNKNAAPSPVARTSFPPGVMPPELEAITAAELVGADSSASLEGQQGTHSSTFVGFGSLNWLNIDQPTAKVRTSDNSPRLRIHMAANPSKFIHIVRLDRNRKDRSLKLHSYNLMSFRTEIEKMLDVDEDWIIQTSIAETSPGVWDMQPAKPLKKGEYALLDARGQTMYDFGIDVPSK